MEYTFCFCIIFLIIFENIDCEYNVSLVAYLGGYSLKHITHILTSTIRSNSSMKQKQHSEMAISLDKIVKQKLNKKTTHILCSVPYCQYTQNERGKIVKHSAVQFAFYTFNYLLNKTSG